MLENSDVGNTIDQVKSLKNMFLSQCLTEKWQLVVSHDKALGLFPSSFLYHSFVVV